jgi:hypothetical protein
LAHSVINNYHRRVREQGKGKGSVRAFVQICVAWTKLTIERARMPRAPRGLRVSHLLRFPGRKNALPAQVEITA